MGNYIFVRMIALPKAVRAVVLPNDDGTFDIYINEMLPEEIQNKALEHEMEHIRRDHLGHHLKHQTVYLDFKKVMEEIGSPETRFHDLRHSYAVAAIKSGDDIKTVQENLGHATAAFTLDVYGHVTDQMKQASAARMEQFIKAVNT